MSWRYWVTISALILLWQMTSPSFAAPLPQEKAADSERCMALSQATYLDTRDAPFVVTNAEAQADDPNEAYCKVEGYVAPEITFEMRLPLSGWNHGFMLVGSGGWATEKFIFLCREPLRRGYACVAGDGGHQTGRGLWMRANPQAKIDWGYRATHVTALAGKALVRAFYGEAQARSLMIGTSTGGYQGLVEAQRFPYDFDGIVAVAPDMDEAGLAMRTLWARRAMTDAGGHPLFSPADLAMLHRAALDRCDGSDGVRDGIIGDPVACGFVPSTITCRTAAERGCLTPQQTVAAAKIYSGPVTSSGTPLGAGGLLPGSELGWGEIVEDRFPDEFFLYALPDEPQDGLEANAFDFDRDHERLGLAGTFISSNPDLRRFRQAGGKLLLVQGANDVVEQPRVLIDYYETVERVTGSPEETRDFARLFIVPGMNHATGGDGAFAIDYLTAIERWLEDGQAPTMLIGSHVPEWSAGLRGLVAGLTAPATTHKVTFTRPVFPYPLHALYAGRGDVNDYRSFRSAAPQVRPEGSESRGRSRQRSR